MLGFPHYFAAKARFCFGNGNIPGRWPLLEREAPRHQQRAGGFNELENKLTSGMIQRVGPSHRNIDITPNLPFANNKKQDMPKLPAMMCPKNLALHF